MTATPAILLNKQVCLKNTNLYFNWKVVGPFNINDIFQNELILDKKRKPQSVKSSRFLQTLKETTIPLHPWIRQH